MAKIRITQTPTKKVRITSVPKMPTGGSVRDKWNQYTSGINPTEQWNHNKVLGSGFDPSVVGDIQQEFQDISSGNSSLGRIGQLAIKAPNGISPVDQWVGTQTGNYSYRPLVYETRRGNTVTGSKNYGTDYERAIAENSNGKWWDSPMPKPWMSNDQNVPMNALQEQIDRLYSYPTIRGIAKPQKDNWHTDENTDYSIDSVRMSKYGGVQPCMGCGGNYRYQMKFGGNSNYAGQTPPDRFGKRSLDTFWPTGHTIMYNQKDPYEIRDVIPESDNPDIFIEKNEIVLQPTNVGMIAQKADTGTHESGDDKGVEVPDGSFVLSDTNALKIKDKDLHKEYGLSPKRGGYTPAKLGGKFVSELNKANELIQDPKTDKLTRDTAQMMVQNYSDKLGKLASIQESMKQQMGIPTTPQMRSGGKKGKVMGQYDPSVPYTQVFDSTGKMTFVPDTNNGLPSIVQEYPTQAVPVLTGNKSQHPYVQALPKVVTGNQSKGFDPDIAYSQVFDENGRMSFVPDTPYREYPDDNNATPFRFDQNPIPTSNEFYTPFVNPQPTNLADSSDVPGKGVTLGNVQSDTPTTDKSTNPFRKGRTTGFTTPDRLALMNSALNYATLHKYQPWEPPVTGVIPRTVYLDPTRALATNSESANSLYRNASAAGNRNLASYLAIQGQASKNAADILGQYSNQNVSIANAANSQGAQITNQLLEAQRNRAKSLYQGNVIAAQQYDNAEREARGDLLNTYQNAWKNRQGYDDLNQTNRFYYRDMDTGRMHFNSPQAQAEFYKEVYGSPSNPSNDLAQHRKYYDMAKQQYPEADETTWNRIADKMYFGNRENDTYDNRGNLKSRTTKQPQMALGGYLPVAYTPPPSISGQVSIYSQPVQPQQHTGDIASDTNNPGNMKYAPWLKRFGASPSGIPGKDGGEFATFPDVESGLSAYTTQLFGTVDGTMHSKYYTPDTTVDKALRTWSNNGYDGSIYPEIRNKRLRDVNPKERQELARRQIKRESGKMYKSLSSSGII